MTKIATALNNKGQTHVASELARMGLKWDTQATCAEIEDMSDFCFVLERGEVQYETPNVSIYISADMVMEEDGEPA